MPTRIAFFIMFAIVPARAPAQSLTIHLYDYSGLTANTIGTMTETATRVFGNSGIPVRWLHCSDVLGSAPECAEPIKADEIIIRLHRSRARSSRAALGVAMIGQDGGQLAIIYVPAVRASAAGLNIPFELLLGYAVAHEVGHCLVGPGHAPVGLMRADWTDLDANQMRQFRLGLSKPEARQALARLLLPALQLLANR